MAEIVGTLQDGHLVLWRVVETRPSGVIVAELAEAFGGLPRGYRSYLTPSDIDRRPGSEIPWKQLAARTEAQDRERQREAVEEVDARESVEAMEMVWPVVACAVGGWMSGQVWDLRS